MVDGEREKLDVMGVKGGDNFNASVVIALALELCLCFLIVPVVSGSPRSNIGTDSMESVPDVGTE